MAISLPIGSSNSGTNDWSDVHGNDAQLVTEIDARDDNYQTLLFAGAGLGFDVGASTFILANYVNISGGAQMAVASGQDVFTNDSIPPVVYFDDADFSISSKTQKLRVRAQVLANATQPTITFTVGLYPVTVAGSADALALTLGTVVTGSTAAIASPAASTVTQANSGDFAIPADGAYALGVVTSAGLTNNNASLVYGYLQTRWV